MSLNHVPAAELLPRLREFDLLIDARSQDEFALDHLPGAVNWPTLDNAERHDIGTMYKQVNPFEARKRGAAIAARNIARHIEREVIDKPREWKPLLYCWRGGQRSGSLALVLAQIGFKVTVIGGGYKGFRAAMIEDTTRRVGGLRFQVVCGLTGCGKTRLLQALARCGAQVLDLEALACHRSSVLGAVPGQPQPSQKAFDTRVWDALRSFAPDRPVFVESESRKIGNLTVPVSLMEAMRESDCLHLRLDDDERVALLMEDYAYLTQQPETFCERLEVLVPLRGKRVVQGWKEAVAEGRLDFVVRELLTTHYDPGYTESVRRNFSRFGSARPLAAAGRSEDAMRTVARQLLSEL